MFEGILAISCFVIALNLCFLSLFCYPIIRNLVDVWSMYLSNGKDTQHLVEKLQNTYDDEVEAFLPVSMSDEDEWRIEQEKEADDLKPSINSLRNGRTIENGKRKARETRS